MSLTDKELKAFKPMAKKYKKSDEKGLYIVVFPNGSKYFRYKYYYQGKEKHLAVGVYPEMSLAQAREKILELRKQLKENIDPSYQKKLEKLTSKISSENTFEAVAKEWQENNSNKWSAKHGKNLLRRLEVDIFPKIGFRAIKDITPMELLSVLKEVEARGALDIVKRLRQICGQVFRYGVVTGRCSRDITPDLKGAIKTAPNKHYAHIEEKELPEFMAKLKNYQGDIQTKLAFELLILTLVRTIELRGMRWSEIDFQEKIWKVPPERMKKRRLHLVPLSKQALEILEELKKLNSGYDYVFPNRNNPTKFMSENTLIYTLYRLGYHSRATVHGFRATASTILNEKGFNSDHIEMQLAHAHDNKVRASYNHAQYLPQRKTMLQWWADFVEGKAKNTDFDKVLNFSNMRNTGIHIS